MDTDANAAADNAISIDEAVANLDLADKREDEAPAQAEQPEKIEAEPAAESASEPETATADDDAETEEGTEEADAELPAIEPPRFWDAQAKDRFRELPRDLQELVLAKETESATAVSKKFEEAAAVRKTAEAEASKIAQLNGYLDKLLPQAVETFKSRWDNVDWNAVVDQYGADQALKLRNQFETEKAQVQQLSAAKAQADQVQFGRFVQAEMAKLPDVCPDLADPKLGEQRRTELAKFLHQETSKHGINPQVIQRMSAWDSSIAYDAMRWRQAQADAQAKTSAPRVPAKSIAPARPSVRPTATPTRSGFPNNARIQQLNSKPSLTTDELVELLDLQG